jgi:hypothetical protein
VEHHGGKSVFEALCGKERASIVSLPVDGIKVMNEP